MIDPSWIEEYKQWKVLRPSQVLLLDEGAQSLSQTWLLNQMWCDWLEMKKLKETELSTLTSSPKPLSQDPWDESPLNLSFSQITALKLITWLKLNKLSLNTGKTELIFFHSKSNVLNYDNIYVN